MNRQFIARHWYASVYEQFENQTHDVDFLLDVIRTQTGGGPQDILEAACGGGRVCIPLARAGHRVTGFDADEHMLLRCCRRIKELYDESSPGMGRLSCYAADGAETDWGAGFDIVVLAGNVLLNIETDRDYAATQEDFIRRAAKALRPGGHLYLDFDLHGDPAAFFNRTGQSRYFEGTDELGTSGCTVSYGSVYDPVTRICCGAGHWELTAGNGDAFIVPKRWHKHIPSWAQVCGWLETAGLSVEAAYRNYTQEPLTEPAGENCWRATVWARKA